MIRQQRILAMAELLSFTLFTFMGADCAVADVSDPYRWSIFDGTELRGFQLKGGSSTIQDGTLWLPNRACLSSESTLGNFLLEFEYWATNSDLGVQVYLRNPQTVNEGNPTGPFFRLTTPVSQRRSFRRRRTISKSGTWRKVSVQVDGSAARLLLSGRSICTMSNLPESTGHVAIRFENSSGSPTAVRRIGLTESDHRPLFNGIDLSGWTGAGADAQLCWQVDNGLLSCTGAKGPWLRTTESFDDFNLRLQYRVKAGGNSGVYVRVPKDGRHHGAGAGVEVQVLDDASPRYAELKPYQFSAGIYAIVAPQQRVSRPAGEWNSLEINCLGKHYTVIHNGVPVIDASDRDVAELGERRVEGFFGLQNHSEEVWFRDIRIGPGR